MVRMLLKGLSTRWRFARAWIRDGKPLWAWLAVATIAFGLPYLSGPTEFASRIRWSGMVFQFLGLLTVVWGLNTSRQLFGRASLSKAVVQWIGRLRYVIKPPKPVSASGHVRAGAVAAAGFAPTVHLSPTASIERRVAKLEEELRKVEGSVQDIKRDVVNMHPQVDEKIETERKEREASDRKVGAQLEEATIGGIHIELAGLAYLFVGIAFTSVPQEAAMLLQKFGL